MAGTVSLVSHVDIKREDFIAFLQMMGAVTNPDEVFDGRLSKGDQTIWIVLDNSDLHLRPDVKQSIVRKLGGDPQTTIVIEIGNAPKSRQLAIEFACMFADRWPCVLYDLVDTVYSTEELAEMCEVNDGIDS